jgi:hypothetical protein
MAARSSRRVKKPEMGGWPLGRNIFMNASDMLWFLTAAKASAMEKNKMSKPKYKNMMLFPTAFSR